MSDTYLTNALIFLLSTLTAFCTYILLCRFILQMLNTDFFNPISQAIVRMTDPPLNPLRRLLPSSKKYDFAAFFIAFSFQLLHVVIAALLYKSNINLGGTILIGLANTLHKMLNLFTFSILGYVLISWLSHGGYNPFLDLIKSISLPLLSRTRRLLPSLGGLDFSPMLAIILLQLIIMLVIIPLRDFGRFFF